QDAKRVRACMCLSRHLHAHLHHPNQETRMDLSGSIFVITRASIRASCARRRARGERRRLPAVRIVVALR
ncbi:MAG: hypothetical protein AB7V59_19290, partial [Gammaproteobacteria bacterium]